MSASNFNELQNGISKALVETTRTTGQLASEDLAFHRSVTPSLNASLEKQSTRLLGLAQELTRAATSETKLSAPHLSDVESVDDQWRNIVDVLDNLLERADASLDEYTGVIKKPKFTQEEQRKQASSSSSKSKFVSADQHHHDVDKPQAQFKIAPANHDVTPFKPLLTSKPHALKSLADSVELLELEDGSQQYRNPYAAEIEAAQTPPIASTKQEPTPFLPFDSTQAIFVDTFDAVRDMLEELKEAEVIAIDLEHHDEHSYIGIVCLMQISTRHKDWVIDTLKPWRQELEVLNVVFTDPRITKVLHGSTMDVIWLQRDLGLYLVGLFDTYHASWALGYPKHSLAFLLKKFVDFDAAKQYQTADWRRRPIPEAMFDYARSDTHFLLYIFDMMRNELIDNSDLTKEGGDLVELVMANSKQEALQRYERPIYDSQRGSGQLGWYNLLYRSPTLFNREQFAVFRALHQWRDEIAREEDESINYVMPRKAMLNIARELPTDMPSLLGCVHPISKFVRQRKQQLLDLIKESRAASASQPEMKEFFPLDTPKVSTATAQSQQMAPNAVRNSGLDTTQTALRSDGLLNLKATTSTLWGRTLPTSGLHEHRSTCSKRADLRLILPLPVLTAEIFVDRTQALQPAVNDGGNAAVRGEHRYTKRRRSNGSEIITLRPAIDSRKRKLENTTEKPEVLNGTTTQGKEDEKDIENGTQTLRAQQESQQRHEKRERRRERKRLKQEAQNGAEAVGHVEDEAPLVPFDYENAHSVLHTAKADRSDRPATKSVNPYAKALDAPKGMRRVQKEIPGRSMTFKK